MDYANYMMYIYWNVEMKLVGVIRDQKLSKEFEISLVKDGCK